MSVEDHEAALDEPGFDADAEERAAVELVTHLKQFAETLNDEDLRMLTLTLYLSLDPLDRMAWREGENLFDEEELTVINSIENETDRESKPQ